MQPTRESLLPRFGAVSGRRIAGRSDLYRVDTVIEKPTPTEAEQRLMVPGMRAGYYLCFFGMHVLTPRVMEILPKGAPARSPPRSPNWPATSSTWRSKTTAAATTSGRRYGVLVAQLALALPGRTAPRCSPTARTAGRPGSALAAGEPP